MSGTILLVEDNPQNRYLATFLLERSGYAVVTAVDGKEAIPLAARIVPRAILLDIQLPGMDGYEVAQLLRAVVALAKVPIIAVTSYAMPGDREKALAAGCIGYLEKPIDPESFVTDIERLLAAHADPGG
jgi:CheY-like chemotaxis protein